MSPFEQLDAVARVLAAWSPTNQNVVEGDYAAAINDLRTAHQAEHDSAELLARQLVDAKAELALARLGLTAPIHAPVNGTERVVARTGLTRAAYSKAADPPIAWAELTPCGHTVFRTSRLPLGATVVCETCAKAARP